MTWMGKILTSNWKVSSPFGKIGHQDFMTGSKRIGQKSLKLLLSCHQEKALELKEDCVHEWSGIETQIAEEEA